MRIFETPGTRRAAAVAVLVIGLPVVATLMAVLVIRLAPGGRAAARGTAVVGSEAGGNVRDTEDPARPSPQAAAARPAMPVAPRRVARQEGQPDRPPAAKPEADRKAKPDGRPEISARDAIVALREAGERGGIAAFPLPGTDPLKVGVVVPESFELPEGFVRHYQGTDDGARLPAILMVHPDYELVDANGKPVEVPDGVVPPELVPAGMPVEMLEVPAERGESDAGR